MDAIKLKGVAYQGLLSVKVPQEFENKELEVIILSAKEGEQNIVKIDSIQHEEKVKRMMRIVGTAKYPDFPISKYDVYDQ